MKHEHTNELYIYWNRIRGHRVAPSRSAIEPADIRTTLKDTFILKVDQPNNYEFRLAGTRTCSLLGREVKNLNFLRLFDDRSADALKTMLHSTCVDATVNVLGLIGKNAAGQTIPLEMLILPLKLNGRTDARIMGCLAPLKMPHWAGLQPISQLQLASLRMIMPHQHNVEISRPLCIDEEVEELIFTSAIPNEQKNARKVGHLTVLDGGLC